MKRVIALVAAFIMSNSFAKSQDVARFATADALTKYEDVFDYVDKNKGKIRIEVNASQCGDDTVNEYYHEVYEPEPSEVLIKWYSYDIITSKTQFTKNDRRTAGRPAFRYINYTISKGNNVTITEELLDAVSYAPLTEKQTMICTLNKGVFISRI